MSLLLKAIAIYRTTLPAEAINHDSTVFQRSDLPVGSIVAEDEEGNFYLYTAPFTQDSHKKRSWPQRVGGVIPLWRDYWIFAAATRCRLDKYLVDLQNRTWPAGKAYPHVSPNTVALYNAGLEVVA